MGLLSFSSKYLAFQKETLCIVCCWGYDIDREGTNHKNISPRGQKRIHVGKTFIDATNVTDFHVLS